MAISTSIIGGNSVASAVGHLVLVGLGKSHVTSDPDQVLGARSLGSTAALAVYDPGSKTGGMLHWMLPDSSIDPRRTGVRPDLFADTGIPRLLELVQGAGAELRR